MVKSNQRTWKVEVINSKPYILIKLKRDRLILKELTEEEFEIIGQAEEFYEE